MPDFTVKNKFLKGLQDLFSKGKMFRFFARTVDNKKL